jgi:hypothetical protein
MAAAFIFLSGSLALAVFAASLFGVPAADLGSVAELLGLPVEGLVSWRCCSSVLPCSGASAA